MDDRELLRRLQAGDESAFDAIFRHWYPALVRAASAMLDPDSAEEVAQNVMVELWRRRHVLDASTTLGGYLMRSVRNRALNQLRHQRVRGRTAADVEELYDRPSGADQPINARELHEAARQAFEQLPSRCREIFALSRVHGLKYSEIAETLGISQKTVEAQMGKALRIMRERLRPWLPDKGSL